MIHIKTADGWKECGKPISKGVPQPKRWWSWQSYAPTQEEVNAYNTEREQGK